MFKNTEDQKGFHHYLLPLTIVVILVIGFAGWQVVRKNKSNNSDSSYSAFVKNGQFDFQACLKEHQKPDQDPHIANDACITLQNQYNDAHRVVQKDQSATQKPQTDSRHTCSPDLPNPALADAKSAFKSAPFDISNIKVVTLGKDTGDARFVYPWVKQGSVNIYAPADGTLFRIRHKTHTAEFNSDDYDLFFLVDCGTVYRFNHITNPRPDIKATYQFGDLPSGNYPTGLDIPERVVPKTNIKVKAGESLGSTSGTPTAHDFDFAVGISKVAPKFDGLWYTVCPFSVFNDPPKTQLMNLLGRKTDYTPVPGMACDVASQTF